MMMKFIYILSVVTILGTTAAAFSLSMNGGSSSTSGSNIKQDRRNFLSATVGAATVSTLAIGANVVPPAWADGDDPYADFVTTESGLRYKVLKAAPDGAAVPTTGQTVKAHYTGWLDGFDSIRKFDSSRDRGRPFTFRVGAGQVIRGWDEAFSAMQVGERRQIILPARLAYGDRGAGGIIPGGATLYFDVELLAIQ